MSASTSSAGAAVAPGVCGTAARSSFRSDGAADRGMRRALRVTEVDHRSGEGAHRTFRISVVISALRCIVTYVAVPVLVPLLSLSGRVAAPVGLALCLVAAVNGVVSLRRFWRADHPQRWTYTLFITIVFAILAVATVTELHRIGAMS